MFIDKKIKLVIFYAKLFVVFGIVGSIFFELPVFQRNIAVSVDGMDEELKISGLYVSDLVNELDLVYGSDNYKINEEVKLTSFITDINKLGIKTKKTIKFKLTAGEKEYTTFTPTIKELLNEANLGYNIENNDVLDQQVTSDVILEERIIEENFAVEVIENAELDEGMENILQEGRNKKASELYSIINNSNAKLGLNILDEGSTRIIEKGTKVTKPAANAPAVATDSVWDQLAFCESGGRWNLSTGNGYYGGIQFSAATWNTASRAVGLDIPYAHMATREEQIMAATWLQTKAGWGQWPACTSKLGLR